DHVRRGRLRRSVPGLRPRAVDQPPLGFHPQGRRSRGVAARAVVGAGLRGRRLARARDVGDVRLRVRRPSRAAPPLSPVRVRGAPPAQGLPAARARREALARPRRRRAHARGRRRRRPRGRRGDHGGRHVSTTNPPLPEFDIDPRAFRHLADAQVGVELDTGDMILNLGPQHPATHGTLRLVVRLDGERVVSADPVIGYMHRGYEKLAEFRTYPQITTLVNRIDWLSSFANEVPFISGAEMLMGIEAPPRAQYIRTILTELSRIATFVLSLGEMGLQ